VTSLRKLLGKGWVLGDYKSPWGGELPYAREVTHARGKKAPVLRQHPRSALCGKKDGGGGKKKILKQQLGLVCDLCRRGILSPESCR